MQSMNSDYMEEVEYSLKLLRILLPVESLSLYKKLEKKELIILSEKLDRFAKLECDLLIETIENNTFNE